MFARYLSSLAKAPWLIGLVAVALVIAVSLGDRYLSFSGNYRVFFDDDDKRVAAYDRIQALYGQADNVFIAIRSPDGVFNKKTLTAVREITADAWELPYVSRVDSIANFQNTYAQDNALVVEDLVGRDFRFNSEFISYVRHVAMNDPNLNGLLLAEDQEATAVNVTVQLPGESADEVPSLAEEARNLAQEYRSQYPQLDIYLAGEVMLTNAFIEATVNDFTVLTPLMFLVVIVVCMLVLRSVVGALLGIVYSAICIKGAMGAAGWAGMMLTPPTAVAPIIVLTITVATFIHIYTTFLQQIAERGEKKAAVLESLRLNLKPVTITSVTTIVGFLALNFSTVPPFRDLGNLIAFGVLCTYFLSLTFLPALLILVPVGRRRIPNPFARAMSSLADQVIERRKAYLIFCLILAVPVSILAVRNEISEKFIEQFSQDIAFRSAAEFVNEEVTGVYNIEYSVGSQEPEGIYDPRFLQNIEQFTRWLRRQDEIAHVRSFTDTLKRVNKNLHNDNQSWYRLPPDRESAAQYILLYEMSLPYGLDVNDQITLDKSSTRVVVTFGDLSTKDVIELENKINAWLEANMTDYAVDYGSPTLMFSHIGDANVRGMIAGTALAFGLIAVLLMLAFRSVKFGLLSMLVNALPITTAFGIWALLVGHVGMGVSVVAGMTIGIVVDDTVHFISKYLHARRSLGMEAETAIRHSFTTVGVAMLTTTLILVAGFTVIAFSDFARNAHMAQATIVTLTMALVYDFLLLPSIILLLERLRHGATKTEKAASADRVTTAGV